MSRFSTRKKLSRGRFLLGAGSAAGALLSGGIAVSRAAGAREPANPAPTYDGYAKNTTGTFAPEGERHLVTSDKPEEIK